MCTYAIAIIMIKADFGWDNFVWQYWFVSASLITLEVKHPKLSFTKYLDYVTKVGVQVEAYSQSCVCEI